MESTLIVTHEAKTYRNFGAGQGLARAWRASDEDVGPRSLGHSRNRALCLNHTRPDNTGLRT